MCLWAASRAWASTLKSHHLLDMRAPLAGSGGNVLGQGERRPHGILLGSLQDRPILLQGKRPPGLLVGLDRLQGRMKSLAGHLEHGLPKRRRRHAVGRGPSQPVQAELHCGNKHPCFQGASHSTVLYFSLPLWNWRTVQNSYPPCASKTIMEERAGTGAAAREPHWAWCTALPCPPRWW